ncbi:12543_t:CDS:2, partial [Gigaspora rosea]
IKNNNIPIKEIEALPVVTLGAGKALVNYKYQIPPIVKLVVLKTELWIPNLLCKKTQRQD